MKILSQGKFRSFDGFQCMGEKPTVVVAFDETKIECTEDHRFLRDDGTWVEARSMKEGDSFNGYKFKTVTHTGNIKRVYDAINVSGTSSFYAEGLTAHNCSFLYIDEAAFVEGWDEFFASVYPTISSGKDTKLLLTSTPLGLNHYWSLWQGAIKGKNGYDYVEVPWHRIPGRDEKWLQDTLESLNHNRDQFDQEFNCAFMGSSTTLISGSALKLLEPEAPKATVNDIKFYEEAKPYHTYVTICDVSRGRGLDYSALTVIDVTEMPYKQVCTFRSNQLTPLDYAAVIYNVCRAYNNSFVLVETNDAGCQVVDALHFDYEYEGILSTQSSGTRGKKISTGFSGGNTERGIRTTKTVKSLGCSMLKLMIEKQQLHLCDVTTIDELKRFSKKGDSYEAEHGSHDDTVMPLVLFAWLTDQQYFKDITNINTLQNLRDNNDEHIENEMRMAGFLYDDHSPHEPEQVIDLTNSWNRPEGYEYF